MTVHNYAEEEVLSKVGEIFNAEEAKPRKSFCTCDFCRTDVACFVLNRVPALYQTSGRGLAHREIEYQEKLQREADLVSLIYRGIERITETRRSHGFATGECTEGGVNPLDTEAASGSGKIPQGFFYNLPQILGRLFHSTSFEPMTGVSVRLLSEKGEEMRMTDSRWTNPCVIPASTPGVFSFWPLPEKASAAGQEIRLELKIAVDSDAYEPLRHYFTLSLVSEEGYLRFGSGNRVLTLPDLFLVPR